PHITGPNGTTPHGITPNGAGTHSPGNNGTRTHGTGSNGTGSNGTGSNGAGANGVQPAMDGLTAAEALNRLLHDAPPGEVATPSVRPFRPAAGTPVAKLGMRP